MTRNNKWILKKMDENDSKIIRYKNSIKKNTKERNNTPRIHQKRTNGGCTGSLNPIRKNANKNNHKRMYFWHEMHFPKIAPSTTNIKELNMKKCAERMFISYSNRPSIIHNGWRVGVALGALGGWCIWNHNQECNK